MSSRLVLIILMLLLILSEVLGRFNVLNVMVVTNLLQGIYGMIVAVLMLSRTGDATC